VEGRYGKFIKEVYSAGDMLGRRGDQKKAGWTFQKNYVEIREPMEKPGSLGSLIEGPGGDPPRDGDHEQKCSNCKTFVEHMKRGAIAENR